eukprot:4351788-Prymnesium_polylepis.1
MPAPTASVSTAGPSAEQRGSSLATDRSSQRHGSCTSSRKSHGSISSETSKKAERADDDLEVKLRFHRMPWLNAFLTPPPLPPEVLKRAPIFHYLERTEDRDYLPKLFHMSAQRRGRTPRTRAPAHPRPRPRRATRCASLSPASPRTAARCETALTRRRAGRCRRAQQGCQAANLGLLLHRERRDLATSAPAQPRTDHRAPPGRVAGGRVVRAGERLGRAELPVGLREGVHGARPQ